MNQQQEQVITEREEQREYICLHCSATTRLSNKDAIKCKECGKNILLKLRNPNKEVQILAI
ncbi:hypothetical protein A0H76_1129 [Hepatospora eriocheir]|uniref:RPC10 n=1 Tax=Hepatospora eriocheir TaxID=1081669 RepID=A0A1X0QKU9_9MICR|nr:hypothetical protein A0H76_1129 [Hepatospora eriocheir]